MMFNVGQARSLESHLVEQFMLDASACTSFEVAAAAATEETAAQTAANHAVFSPKPPPPAPIGQWVPQPNTNPSTHMGPAAQPQHQQQHNSPVINVRLVGQRLPTSPSQGAVYLQQRANMSSVASFVLPTSVKPPTAATTTTAAAAAAAATTAAATTSKPGHGAPTGLEQGPSKRGRWVAHVPAHSVEGGKVYCKEVDGWGPVPAYSGQSAFRCPLCKKTVRFTKEMHNN